MIINFIEKLKSNANYKKQLLDELYEETGYYSNSDLGNAIILSAKRVVYTIRKLNGPEMIDDDMLWGCTVVREPLINSPQNIQYPKTKEKFLSLMDEWYGLVYPNIINKFKKHIWGDNIPASRIDPMELDKLKCSYDEDITGLINEVSTFPDWVLSDWISMDIGYSLSKLTDTGRDECTNYVKKIIIDLIQETSKEIMNIICNDGLNLHPESDINNILLVHDQSHNLSLNYSNNKEIAKHFANTNNIIIHDPCVQHIFEKELVVLSKELDKVDEELGFKEPSQYGFEQFIDPLHFKVVRLNKKGNFLEVSDNENYIAILIDEKNSSCIIKPSKKSNEF